MFNIYRNLSKYLISHKSQQFFQDPVRVFTIFLEEYILKYFILFLSFYFSGACMHIERQRQREVDRNYVFNIDKLGRNWPRGYEVEGKFRGQGPEIEYIKIPYQIDGSNLIEGHGVWVLKNNGRWISSQEDK